MCQDARIDVPPGHRRVFRKEFDLLIEADSYPDALRMRDLQVGDRVGSVGIDILFEDVRGFEGDDQPLTFPPDVTLRFPSKATMAALTDSIDEAIRGFRALDGSFTVDPSLGCEINFDAVDESSPVEGTMPAP